MAARDALAGHLAEQAAACRRMGSPLYERLLLACVDDLLAGGPVADVLADQIDAPGPAATGLRLLGGVHRVVLDGRAPRLARQYPSAGGSPDDDLVADFLGTLVEHADELRAAVLGPPQTNEVGRAGALVGGLLHVLDGLGAAGTPVRLHEIGASAGLNLLADRYRYGTDAGWWWGPEDAAVELPDAWRGHLPDRSARLRLEQVHGSDVAPVDLSDPAARSRLLGYVWADQTARVDRTRAALAVAAEHPPVVERVDAVTAASRLVPTEGTVTVLWHSVMWQYLPAEDQTQVLEALDRAGRRATATAPLVHLAMEPRRPAPGQPHEFLVTATTWPGGADRLLGRSVGHGLPTEWVPPDHATAPRG